MAVIGGNLAFGIQWRHFTTSRDSNVDVTSTTSFLKTVESLQNGVATYFQATPLFSMRTELLVSSQSCHSADSDAWCKRALKKVPIHNPVHTLRKQFNYNYL